MKSQTLFIILMFGMAKLCFAGTGNSNDGLTFFLFISGILLIVALVLYLADYLRKNGSRVLVNITTIFDRCVHFIRKLRHSPKDPLILSGSLS